MAVLLNPGPVNLSERVRNALLKPDLCHREREFSELQNAVREKLLNVYQLDNREWAAVLLTGSGTSAMEAMLTSMAGRDQKVLIIENGVYGERLTQIARLHAIPCDTLRLGWGEAVAVDRLEEKLSPDIAYVLAVHHETTTGRLNDLAAIARAAERRRIPLLVDGVSSFGAEEIRFKDWNIAACAGTANKCLHGVPGISFVIVNREVLAAIEPVQRSLYLHLPAYLKQQDAGGTPFTQSVQVMYALNEALDEHRDEGGWQRRRETYNTRMKTVRVALEEINIQPLLNEADCSCVLHSYHLPRGMSYQSLHDGLKERGFVIYAGQGELAKTIFRISLMGAIGDDDIDRFIKVMQEILQPPAPGP